MIGAAYTAVRTSDATVGKSKPSTFPMVTCPPAVSDPDSDVGCLDVIAGSVAFTDGQSAFCRAGKEAVLRRHMLNVETLLQDVPLPDQRVRRRAAKLVQSMVRGHSPSSLGCLALADDTQEALTRGAYRFFDHEGVTKTGLQAPMQAQPNSMLVLYMEVRSKQDVHRRLDVSAS